MKRCRICWCTEDRACPGGCSWVQAPAGFGDVCSACRRIAAELGTILAIATRLPDKAAELGWQALWFIVCDTHGPRARLTRWEPGPHYQEPSAGVQLADFLTRGRAAQAAVDQVLAKHAAVATAPKRRPKRKVRR